MTNGIAAATLSAERVAPVTTVTSEQIRAGRALLRWEQRDLAEASGLAVITIKSIERRPGPLQTRTTSLYKLMLAFDRAGVEFFDGDNGGAGVRFKRGAPLSPRE